ncbi:hypothetical protein ACIQUQ_04280 [Streptomyces sp. NPDC101118]|uniref:hypothetical protein n=1 Tax=Streptomyces sp. NPDC101118 TaxID=3366109 RepID=UPI00382B3C34
MAEVEFFTHPHGTLEVWGIRVDGVDLRELVARATGPFWEPELLEGEPERNPEERARFVLGQHRGLAQEDVPRPFEHFTGRPSEEFREIGGGRSVLLGCPCGVWECWPLCAHIEVAADTVTWSGFLQPYRQEEWGELPLGPYVFDRARYEASLAHPLRLTADPLAARLHDGPEGAPDGLTGK